LSSLGALETLSDARLAAAVEEELASLTPRARAFALALGSGQPATEAARSAQLSVQPVALMRQKRRTAAVLRLLREQARRASMLTLEVAVEKFRTLSEEARTAEDYSAAARALREACLLLDLYPSEKVDVTHRVNLREVSVEEWERLAQLRHVVRQALPARQRVLEAAPSTIPLETGTL
jgi:hypothetical protein